MAITYKELKRLIRFKTKDFNETTYSDFEIKESFNECIRYFNASHALNNSDFIEKVAVYDEAEMNLEIEKQNQELPEDEQLEKYNFRETGVELPNGFITLQSIMRLPDGYIMSPVDAIKDPAPWQYKIMGDRLYLGCPYAKMLYKGGIDEIKSDDDTLELPNVFKDALVKITCMILTNTSGTDVLADAVDEVVSAIVPRRRYSNGRIKMPFKV